MNSFVKIIVLYYNLNVLRRFFMVDEELEKLRDSYYSSIVLLQDEKDILEALPSPEFQNFFPLMEGVISKLVAECREFSSLGEDADVLEEVDSLKRKIALCQKRVESVTKQLKDESMESQDSQSKRHLIFAKTAFGSTFLQRDLKDIPREYYDKVQAALETLEYGDFGSNPEKVRQFTNNKKLFGLYEIKEFKIRLIYRVLSGDMVYVMQTRMKKDDNSMVDKRDLISRSKNTNDEFYELKRRVQNPTDRELLIMENEAIKGDILKMLGEGKKGSKGDIK